MSDPIIKCQGCGYMGVEGVEIYGGVCQSCGDPDYKEKEMTKKNEIRKFRCILCNEIWVGYGHNPKPLAKEGRCCDNCNVEVIIERIRKRSQGK